MVKDGLGVRGCRYGTAWVQLIDYEENGFTHNLDLLISSHQLRDS